MSYAQFTVMCVCALISRAFPLLFFSFLLLVLMMNLIVLLFADSLSKTVGIIPVFNNTLTFPTPKDPASSLYG